MTISEIATLVGFAILLFNAGIQWGIQLATKSFYQRELDRIEREVQRNKTLIDDGNENREEHFRRMESMLATMATTMARLEERLDNIARRRNTDT